MSARPPVHLLFESGLRRSLMRARLAAEGIETFPLERWPDDPLPGSFPLVLADVAIAGLIQTPGAAWFEVFGEQHEADEITQLPSLGRCRLLDPAMVAPRLARVAAPHDDAGHALDPDQWRSLEALAAAAPARVAKILADYRAGTHERLERLEALVRSQETGALGREAHAWKGAAAGVGADRLADALLRLEADAALPPARLTATLEVVALRSAAADRALAQRLAGLPS